MVAEIRPEFDLALFRKQLQQDDEKKRIGLIRGLKLWHASKEELAQFVKRIGLGTSDVYRMIQVVVDTCAKRMKYQRPKLRPTVGAEMSGWFNDNVFIDLIFLLGGIFIIIIDEATRHKVIQHITSSTGETIMKAIMKSWTRYFGPMRTLIFDQGGGIKRMIQL